MGKRLIFSTPTPNDQGGVIPNEVIDFNRYLKNPVVLKEHWWGGDPIGKMTDVQLIGGKWSGIPVFHGKTKESKEAQDMYEADQMKAASIGGDAVWKKNPVTDEYVRDAQGFKQCEHFYLYEISLVGLPSNEDCVTEEFAATQGKYYDDMESKMKDHMHAQILELSSKFNTFYMSEKKTTTATGQEAQTGSGAAAQQNGEATTLAAAAASGGAASGTEDLPPIIKKVIEAGGTVVFSATNKLAAPPSPDGLRTHEEQGNKENGDTHPNPIGLKAKAYQKAQAKAASLHLKAEDAVLKAKKAKEEADEDGDSEMKASASTAANLAAQAALDAYLAAEKECEAAKDEADDEEQDDKEKKAAKANGRTSLAATPTPAVAQPHRPQLKTATQLASELNLAKAPSLRAIVKKEAQGVTFTRLNSAKADENDRNLLRRVFNAEKKTTDTVSVQDHAVILSSILNDPRLSPIAEKARVMVNVSDNQMRSMMNNYKGKRGMSMHELAADLAAGRGTYWNRSNGAMENLTLLTSTDTALASPALNTIEWLSLAIFELFPTTSWKASIPMFAANMASANTGTIWANIVAQPTIYKGTNPAPAADYTYQDAAVSLALTPYWLQPMLWNPLTMHQLRYDQMSTGWAQAFAVWNAVMDDNLLYTLGSTVPAGAIIPTSGLSGYQQQPQSFNIPNSGAQNSFYWSPNFQGNLLYPVLNDIIALEQVYRNQNFELEREKAVLVIDPIMERYMSMDPETKSLLTAWVSRDGEQFKAFKHTMLDIRSRVVVYDPASKQVKDINGIIPNTAVSAALGFIPSQVGMAIGMLDVFMIQDPANYGYRMSADIRIGIAPLRNNFYGTSLLTYGAANV